MASLEDNLEDKIIVQFWKFDLTTAEGRGAQSVWCLGKTGIHSPMHKPERMPEKANQWASPHAANPNSIHSTAFGPQEHKGRPLRTKPEATIMHMA